MKINYLYGDKLAINFYCYNDEVWQWGWDVNDLDTALDIARDALDRDELVVPADEIERVLIVSETTGEIIAECLPDEDEDCDLDFDNPNYDPDWGYNEDFGFDPYIGCYFDDC